MNLGKENEYQRFKTGLSQLDKGLKFLTAMLNKHGEGTLYFGVKDNGDVKGLRPGDESLMDIRGRIRDKIEPRVYPKIEVCTDEDKQYIKVFVQGTDIPYAFDGRYYIRTVAADEQADNAVLRKMPASTEADILRQKESLVQSLKFSALFSLLAASGVHPAMSGDFLGNCGLLNTSRKYNGNACLLADQNEVRINVVTFAGTDKSVISLRTEYGGQCLLSAMREVMEYFNSINTTRVDVTDAQREEIPLFDKAGFREAWINACLHND